MIMMKADVQENNSKILDRLQEAVNAETTSRNLYWARGVFWRSVGLTKLADYYLEQSGEDHAQRSADRMAFLGRQPTMDPTRVAAVTETNVSDQLQVDLQVEIALADDYAGWITDAEDTGDHVTSQMWKEVLRSTQEHIDLLQGWLKQIDMISESNWLASWR
jgi:bacterioferritin